MIEYNEFKIIADSEVRENEMLVALEWRQFWDVGDKKFILKNMGNFFLMMVTVQSKELVTNISNQSPTSM